MGAIIFIILAVLIYLGKILHNSRDLTFDKWAEIFISFFIFTNCIGFGLPLIDIGEHNIGGAIGIKYRLEVYMIIAPLFFIILQRRFQWKLMPIPWYVVFGIVLFCAINLFNPNNSATDSTIIGLLNILSYLLFLYLICSCVDNEVIMRGIYDGFTLTIILQAILTLCFPILGIDAVVELFREGVSIRAEERPGAPGTFNHPNNLGGYMSYIVAFFVVCYLFDYRKQTSLWLGLAATFVLVFTFSRTALLGTIIAVIVLVVIYRTRESSLFTLKNVFTLIIPLIAVAAALIFLTPIKDSFIGSNMDEMMLARLMHYYCGYETIMEYPILGVGFNSHLEYIRNNISFGSVFGNIDKIFWQAEVFMFSNPIHNIFLIFASELGIVGTLPVLYYIGYKFFNIKKVLRSSANDTHKMIALYAVGLVCCVGVHGMADWAPLSALLRNIWVLVLFMAAIQKTPKSEEREL